MEASNRATCSFSNHRGRRWETTLFRGSRCKYPLDPSHSSSNTMFNILLKLTISNFGLVVSNPTPKENSFQLHFVLVKVIVMSVLVRMSINGTWFRHSAGANVAVDAYFEAPERVAALILVAPAILPPFMANSQKQSKGGGDNQSQGNGSGLNTDRNLFHGFYDTLSKFTTYIAEVITRMVKGMTDVINFLYKKALSSILRSAFGVMVLRMIINKFGVAAVRSAWYDPNKVTDLDLQGYTKPLKVRGWDKALAEYTVALLTDTASKLKPPPAKRLMDISCPVLIVTGDSDRLVPSWNSERLSGAIPESHFKLIKNCGHLPHEEKAEEFVSIVDKFLQSVFGTAEEPRLQVVT